MQEQNRDCVVAYNYNIDVPTKSIPLHKVSFTNKISLVTGVPLTGVMPDVPTLVTCASR